MDKYEEWLIIAIEYPEDWTIEDLELNTHTIAIIEWEKSGITEGYWITYYILSDYFNLINEIDQSIIKDNCNIKSWDPEDKAFEKDINDKANNLGVSSNKLLDIMWL